MKIFELTQLFKSDSNDIRKIGFKLMSIDTKVKLTRINVIRNHDN